MKDKAREEIKQIRTALIESKGNPSARPILRLIVSWKWWDEPEFEDKEWNDRRINDGGAKPIRSWVEVPATIVIALTASIPKKIQVRTLRPFTKQVMRSRHPFSLETILIPPTTYHLLYDKNGRWAGRSYGDDFSMSWSIFDNGWYNAQTSLAAVESMSKVSQRVDRTMGSSIAPLFSTILQMADLPIVRDPTARLFARLNRLGDESRNGNSQNGFFRMMRSASTTTQ